MIGLQVAQHINSQLAASILLVLYLATAVILFPRELNFLKQADAPARGKFIILDALVQLCILAVLLPNVLSSKLSLELLILVVSAFTLLWVVAGVNIWQRYIYTYRMLSKTIEEQKTELLGLENQLKGEENRDG